MKQNLAAVGVLRVFQILIDETAAIGQPVGRLRFVGNLEGQHLTGIHVEQMKCRVFVSGAISAVSHELAIGRRRGPFNGGQAAGVELGWIDEHLRLAFVAFAPIDDGLVLGALALRKEIAVAPNGRRGHRANLHQRSQPILEGLPARQMVQDRSCIRVLRVGPRRHGRCDFAALLRICIIAFEPPIVVYDLNTVHDVLHGLQSRCRRLGGGAQRALRASGNYHG